MEKVPRRRERGLRDYKKKKLKQISLRKSTSTIYIVGAKGGGTSKETLYTNAEIPKENSWRKEGKVEHYKALEQGAAKENW